MKRLSLIVFTLVSTFTVIGQVQSDPTLKMKDKTEIDTLLLIKKADSLAASILKTYNENSLRQTGVPLCTEHYNKKVTYNSSQNNILVTYSYSKTKFYGPKGSEKVLKDEEKYPFHFDILLDIKTNIASLEIIVENR